MPSFCIAIQTGRKCFLFIQIHPTPYPGNKILTVAQLQTSASLPSGALGVALGLSQALLNSSDVYDFFSMKMLALDFFLFFFNF